ncbi:MAG: hypothetical protein JJT77_03350 [Crocinitomicaceae bacterium]|nr:hypothetical protein [Crocinitomicaceae bacterium]
MSTMKCFTPYLSKLIANKWFWSLLLFPFLFACHNREEKLASIEDEILYFSDFESYASMHDISLNDSLAREKFIENWFLQQKISLTLKEKFPEKYQQNKWQAAQTFHRLNAFDLENELILQSLDSTVTEDEIMHYYKNNRNKYVQESFIVKALYIKVDEQAPGINRISQAFLLKNDKDIEEVIKFGNLYASSFYFEKDKWIFFEDLVRDIPINEDIKENMVLTRGNSTFRDQNYLYFLNILDFKLKKTTAPLDFERESIRKHILKRRVNNIRKEVNETIEENVQDKYTIRRY